MDMRNAVGPILWQFHRRLGNPVVNLDDRHCPRIRGIFAARCRCGRPPIALASSSPVLSPIPLPCRFVGSAPMPRLRFSFVSLALLALSLAFGATARAQTDLPI